MANVEYLDLEGYFEKLGLDACKSIPKCSMCGKKSCASKKELEDLLNISIEQRKSAIEHYWNRANYFWLFVAAFFVAYVETLPEKGGCCGGSNDSQMQLVNLLICIGGLFCSICWYMANRGSKFRQENWELHINVISAKLGKPIFQILKNPKICVFNLFSYYPYSFTRINLLLNLITIEIWFFLALLHVDFIADFVYLELVVIGVMLFSFLVSLIHMRNYIVRACKKNKEPSSESENKPFVYIPN